MAVGLADTDGAGVCVTLAVREGEALGEAEADDVTLGEGSGVEDTSHTVVGTY